jgi:hypothetical protein
MFMSMHASGATNQEGRRNLFGSSMAITDTIPRIPTIAIANSICTVWLSIILVPQGSVDQFFDARMYQEVLSDNPQETVDRLIQERVRFI